MATTVASRSRSFTNLTTKDFPQFSQLPPEVRRAIWHEAALEAYKDRHLKSIHVSRRMKPSAIFLVNRESRRVARRIYNISLHVYESHANAISSNGCDGPVEQNGDCCDVVYQGEVHISFVHDIFVTLDDSGILANPPANWEDEHDHAYWMSYKITGRLSEKQTESIERVMAVHWTNVSEYTSRDGSPTILIHYPKALMDEALDDIDQYDTQCQLASKRNRVEGPQMKP
ncbi:hypothetical protein PG994_002796 [Apiospora phragmitis]|uniref:2EXR domain-containing protein n=1 Tax=Apiospora phragmitis TaxID=2905665 RepID=A0ABR1W662_9PEZI